MTDITKLENGSVEIKYSGKEPITYSNLTNVMVSTSTIGLGWIQVATPELPEE